jgi:hypothetical protein
MVAARASLALFLCACAAHAAQAQPRTENVILVTLDGARHQEMFNGLDRDLLQASVGKTPVQETAAYRKYWAPTVEERRRKLLPFFWGTLMTHGSIAGNPLAGSTVRVTNGHRFSYPGYSEILTGQAFDDDIKSNDLIQNPHETVLEFVRHGRRLPRSKVAAFASWGVFAGIVERVAGTITTNAGQQRLELPDPAVALVNRLQFEVMPPWDLIRHDAFTFRLAMAYLKAERPRLLYLALDETDDWAHDGKYGLVLDALARTDRQLRELWEWVESDAQYRGKTTIILTTDHGRGKTAADWRSHGRDIEGAQDIWVAIAGPDSPRRGEWKTAEPLFQNQIAATVARFFGLDFAALRPSAGPPIAGAWSDGATR